MKHTRAANSTILTDNMNDRLLKRYNHLTDVSLKDYSTFKIGGTAKYLFQPLSLFEFTGLIQELEEDHIPYHIIGRGSNILFADEMKTKCIIVTSSLNQIGTRENKIIAECGAPLRSVCYTCLKDNLSGMEGLSGIPGTVGGAVYMNAGAYGFSVDRLLSTVEVFNRKDFSFETLDNRECRFSYRNSIFMDSDLLILRATFVLERKETANEIEILMSDFERRRAEKQPLDFPSAGSVFKKPHDNFYPAKVIQELGLKGFTVGGAGVSEKHSGFIINRKNASSEDVRMLIEHVREKVIEKTGIFLQTEIKYMD
ncbi:MAG TPA: UDP-N-acetylmuramate dehydrogenase [Thermotogota bacterium]|nr:UDP-N-acetylmuramate dehydrogenase [Thermotogota bacterium]